MTADSYQPFELSEFPANFEKAPPLKIVNLEFRKFVSINKSKYLLTLLGLAVWMFFFDDRDIITTHIRHPRELRQLQQSKTYYQQQITNTRTELKQLKLNAATIEKYAREKYFMKRDNEDLFIITDQ